MRKIYVADQTLKNLTAESSAPLLFREKTAIAAAVDAFGADAIELYGVRSEREDAIIFKTVSKAVKNCAVCIPVGKTAEEAQRAWECVCEAKKPCLQVLLPVSTVQMEYSYHFKNEKMLEKIKELCAFCKEKGAFVEFAALDATRADSAFLADACKTAADAGADAVTLCDDAGIMLPDEFSEFVSDIKSIIALPVYVQVSDALGLGIANALAAIKAGADGVKTAAVGKNALITGKFAAALNAVSEKAGVYTGLAATEIYSDSKALLKKLGRTQDKPSADNRSEEDIFLDADSTLTQVCEAVGKLGYELAPADNGRVFDALRRVFEKKSFVGAAELEAIVAASAVQVPSAFHVESYIYSGGSANCDIAQVTLLKNGEKLMGAAYGDGPIEASFNAIDQCIGYHYELDDYQIQAVTEGREALGSALVKLRSGGKLYSGNGISADIVDASIRAYVNALNKIVYENGEV